MMETWKQQRDDMLVYFKTTGSRKIKSKLSKMEHEITLYPNHSEGD